MPSLQQMFSLPLASPKWRVRELAGAARTRLALRARVTGAVRAGRRSSNPAQPAARPTPKGSQASLKKHRVRGSPGPRSPGQVGGKLP